jgi:hypothetical protein
VQKLLTSLHLYEVGSPTLVALIALAVTGLILLDARHTQTRMTRILPARCHDALNRLLRQMPFSTRALMGLLVAFVKRLGLGGYLCLDDVVVEKAYAKRLRWAGWTYSFAKRRKVYGLHIVVLLWCSGNGRWRVPVAFRVWRPRRSSSKRRYQTKLQLAETMVLEVVAQRLPFEYIVFDTHYTAGWFTKRLHRLGLKWQGTLDPRTNVMYRDVQQPVGTVASTLKLKWRAALGVRAKAVVVRASKYGTLRLVVTRNRHGNFEYLVTNDLSLGAHLTAVEERKRSRWSIETLFRDAKQLAGLQACQCWVDQAMVRHVAVVMLTFVVLQLMRQSPRESVAAVKERWQLGLLRNGEVPPQPLLACPPELRPTA